MDGDHYRAAVAVNAGTQFSGSRRIACAAKLIAWYQPHKLRQRCDAMSPSVLYQRLAELTEAQLISQDTGNRYRLTPLEQTLAAAIAPLDQWANTWARQTAASPKQP